MRVVEDWAATPAENGGAELENGGKVGGDRGARTPNLGIANAALSQLSYIPRGTAPSVFAPPCMVDYQVLGVDATTKVSRGAIAPLGRIV